MHKIKGFTLIELVMVIIIFGIIATIITQTLSAGFSSYATAKDVVDSTWQARVALTKMKREIRAIRNRSSITTIGATSFTFTDLGGTAITFSRTGTNLMHGTNILASNISNLAFTYLDVNGAVTAATANVRYITITITVTGNNANFTVTTAVNPRDVM